LSVSKENIAPKELTLNRRLLANNRKNPNKEEVVKNGSYEEKLTNRSGN
jgi:hypothetical protein